MATAQGFCGVSDHVAGSGLIHLRTISGGAWIMEALLISTVLQLNQRLPLDGVWALK